ncbi:tobH protein [Rhodococcus sp. SGAir0479]|uniref:tobH protein n=1 Tax=Rhodococcus sp. SGAir0479 TaxID=2567884 RepID=UPI0010CD393A|nr:tobH protein [Rhodococcus sp. SGAir0479]QCQ92002.1 tobH protein [Rhodococcus sp. SGAir0479]
MTAPSSLLDLDDVDALLAADVEGSLRFAALGGAQIRATQAAVDEGELARLHGLQPRSVVLVTGVGAAARAADLLIATVGGRIGIPLVETTVTPLWVGPLDVVVVAGDDAGDPRLVESVDRALRRGAEVVVAAPDEGPLRAAGAGRAHALPPRVTVPDHNALLRYLAAFLAVLVAIESGRAGAAAYPDLGRLADALDDEALRDHPRNEVFHNPAKSLAARMQGRRVVLAGATRATTHLARHAGDVLLRTGAAVAAAADLAEVIAGVPRFAAATPLSADYDPFFHDEQLDGPAPGMPLRVFVLASDADRPLAERRAAVLADADVVVAASVQAGPPGPAGPVDPAQPTPVGAVGEIEQTAVLVCRLEMSAAYLRLIGGN